MGMVGLDACIYAAIALLGVAYPILLQVISRLDDKYSSTRAVALFDGKPENRAFTTVLLLATAAVVRWFCKLTPFGILAAGPDWLQKFAGNSALSLVYAATLALLGCFFLLTRKIFIYYNTQKFIGYLQHKHRYQRSNELYFGILTDIFTALLSANNFPLLWSMQDFFTDEFLQVRHQTRSAAVVYPAVYNWSGPAARARVAGV